MLSKYQFLHAKKKIFLTSLFSFFTNANASKDIAFFSSLVDESNSQIFFLEPPTGTQKLNLDSSVDSLKNNLQNRLLAYSQYFANRFTIGRCTEFLPWRLEVKSFITIAQELSSQGSALQSRPGSFEYPVSLSNLHVFVSRHKEKINGALWANFTVRNASQAGILESVDFLYWGHDVSKRFKWSRSTHDLSAKETPSAILDKALASLKKLDKNNTELSKNSELILEYNQIGKKKISDEEIFAFETSCTKIFPECAFKLKKITDTHIDVATSLDVNKKNTLAERWKKEFPTFTFQWGQLNSNESQGTERIRIALRQK
jgi:hypothetical protein